MSAVASFVGPMTDLGYRLSDYDFELPEHLIAQEPAPERDASRLLVFNRSSDDRVDARFSEIDRFLAPGDLLVLNNTKVFPARLRGTRSPGGGAAEVVLVQERENQIWEALARPGRRLKPGARIKFGSGELVAEVVEITEDGRRLLHFHSEEPFWEVVDRLGEPPLPPYIKRPEGTTESDRDRYQTVYASERGAVAAPTAGLHFTANVLERLRDAGVRTAELTLHVGYGTFEPVRVDDLRDHRVLAERYEVPHATASLVAQTRAAGGRIVAVGTTTTRALEAASDEEGNVSAGHGLADLTITPGYRFKVAGGMVTNFHLPQSSLLVLVATFAGRPETLAAYRHAVDLGYRFYSYGDAMLVL